MQKKQYQVTLVCTSGKYRPISCIVNYLQEDDSNKLLDPTEKRAIVREGIHKICAKHYWTGSDLKKYDYLQTKVREYDKEKIEAEKLARYEKIKEEKYASGEWKRPKN